MKAVITLASALLISLTVNAKFIENFGQLGVFPNEDEKLGILQTILLESTEKAHPQKEIVTLDTSLTQMRMYKEISPKSIQRIFVVAQSKMKAIGCTMTIGDHLGEKLYFNIKFNGRGNLSTLEDLLPKLNNSIDCP